MQNTWKWLVLLIAVGGGGFAVFQVNESLTQLASESATTQQAAEGQAAAASAFDLPPATVQGPTVSADRDAGMTEPAEEPLHYDDLVPVADFTPRGAATEPAPSQPTIAAAPEPVGTAPVADGFGQFAPMQSPEPAPTNIALPGEQITAASAMPAPSDAEIAADLADIDPDSVRGQSPDAWPTETAQPIPGLRDRVQSLQQRLTGGQQQLPGGAVATQAEAAPQPIGFDAAAAFGGAAATMQQDAAAAQENAVESMNAFAAQIEQLPQQAAQPIATAAEEAVATIDDLQSAAGEVAGQLPPADMSGFAAFEAAPAFDPVPAFETAPAAEPPAAQLPPQPAPLGFDGFDTAAAEPVASGNPLDQMPADAFAQTPRPASEPTPIPVVGDAQPEPIQPVGGSGGFGFGPSDVPEPANFDLSARDRRRQSQAQSQDDSGLIRVESQPLSPAAEVRDLPQTASRDVAEQFLGRSTIDRQVTRGPVQPELQIMKQAPKKASIGQPFVYEITVRNVGRSAATKVVVEDRVPKGSRLEGTIPKAEISTVRGENVLFWEFDQIGPMEDKLIRVKVTPTDRGQIGSITTVRMVAETAAETVVTAPELSIDLQGVEESQLGEVVSYTYQIRNTGSEDAHDVKINSLIPEGLAHEHGPDIEYSVGTLKAGDEKAVRLPLRAVSEGHYIKTATLTARGGVTAKAERPISIIKSRLSISRTGPSQRFVGAKAEFTNTIRNNSSKTLRNIRIVEQYPVGSEFVAASDSGREQVGDRSIVWMIPSLPPNGSRELSITMVPRQPGQARSTVRAESDDASRAIVQSDLKVVGFSSLKIETEHANRPYAVGEQIPMTVQVKNGGSAAANMVAIDIRIPATMRVVQAEGPTAHKIYPEHVSFDPIPSIAAGAAPELKLIVEPIAEGNEPLRLVLQANELGQKKLVHDQHFQTYVDSFTR